MQRRIFKIASIALMAWLGLCAMNRIAQAQQGGGGGGLGGGSGGGGGGGGGGGAGNSLFGSGGQSTVSGAGASGGAGFSGGQGGFSGQTAGTTSTRTGGASGGAAIPSKFNPFGGYYANPLSMGLSTGGSVGTASTAGKATFGQPLYATTTTNSRQTGGGGARTNRTSAATAVIQGFTTYGMDRDTPYATDLSDDVPLISRAPAAMQKQLKDVLQRSTILKNKDGVNLSIEGGTVILRGQVASPREQRLVEAMVRLTPGVLDVSNELVIAP